MQLLKCLLLGVLSVGLLTGCGISKEDQEKIDNYDEMVSKYEDLKEKYNKIVEEKQVQSDDQKQEAPKIGEYFELPFEENGDEIGKFGVKVVSAKETSERAPDEESIEHIALVELEFTNKTGKEVEILSSYFNVIDSEGFQGRAIGTGYEPIKGELQVTIPKGGKARTYFRYEVGTPEPYSVQAGYYVVK